MSLTNRAPQGLSPGNHTKEGESLEIQRYIGILLERRYLILGFVVVALVLAGLWTASQPKIYEARAKIIFKAANSRVPGSDVDTSAGNYYLIQDYLQTSRQELISDSLARRAASRLKLQSDAGFYLGGEPLKLLQQAGEALLGHYTADVISETRILVVTARHQSPEWAKKIADAVADEFVEGSIQERDSSTQTTSQQLTDRLDDVGKRLHDAEVELYNFKVKHNLLSVNLQDQTNQIQRQIGRYTDALTEIRLQKRQRQSKLEQLKKFKDLDPLQVPTDQGTGTPAIVGDLRRVWTEEDRRLAELRARYQDTHPQVLQQAAKVANVLRDLKREVDNAQREVQRQYDEIVSQEQKVLADLEAVKQEGLKLDKLSIEFNQLRRQAESLQQHYGQIANSSNQTGTVGRLKTKNIDVLDHARLPQTPVSPRLRVALVMAAVLGLFLGVLVVFLGEALDRSIKSQEDVESRLHLPFLGMLPRFNPADGEVGKLPDLYVADHPRSTVAEACRTIRTNVLFAGADRELRKILVTSSMAREGKTLSCVSLGSVLAQAGARTLIIDCDLRRPRIAKAFGVRGGVGLTNVLLGEVSAEEAIRKTPVPGLSLLTSGPIPPNPAELLDGPNFRALLDKLAETYDRVLIDSPPAAPVTDPAILATQVDGVVLVVRHSVTNRDVVKRAANHVLDVGGRIIGVVLNDIDTVAKGYRGYYGGYYHYYQSEYREDEPGTGKKSDKSASSTKLEAEVG